MTHILHNTITSIFNSEFFKFFFKKPAKSLNDEQGVEKQTNNVASSLSFAGEDLLSDSGLETINDTAETDAEPTPILIEQMKTEKSRRINVENVENDNANAEKEEKCPVYALRFILEKTGLAKLFDEYVPDPRRGECVYSSTSLLMTIVIMHILRFSSRHGFHDQIKLSQTFGVNIAKLAGSNGVPSPKTFEDFFIQLDEHILDPILPALFRWLLRSKFFELHPEFKGQTVAGNKKAPFILAVDAHVIHIYTNQSQHPCANCPYCLSRTRGDKVWYVHYDVVLSVIGENGFQMPLFVYRVKKQQISKNGSEASLKQECELSALPYLLEQFRCEFPRLLAVILLDSLYANGPTMGILEKYHFDFIIVRKEGSLRSFNNDIEGQKKFIKPLKRSVVEGRWIKEMEVYIFPNMSHQDHQFTIIDLVEECYKASSSRFAKVTEKTTHWQWVVSQKVDPQKVFKIVHQARLRWFQEDFFNTMQRRGYSLLHDFSRNPISQSIWHLLMFIAFTISMLMQLSRLGVLLRKSVSFINWIKHLFAVLAAGRPDFNRPLPKQLRFYFDTS